MRNNYIIFNFQISSSIADVSIYINKIWVLLVCQVLERRRVQPLCVIRDHIGFPQSSTDFLLSSVFPLERVPEDEEQDEFGNVCDKERSDAEMVRWRLFGLVKEGSGDVSDARAKPDHPGHDHLLGLSSCVARY